MSAELLKLRGYQREAIDAVWEAHAAGMKRPAIVLATGSGKTVIMSHAIREYRSRTARRAMVLVHREELADQTIAKLRAVAPHLKTGKVKAGDDDIHADVVVASVQTVSRERRLARLVAGQERAGAIGFVLTDECHHSAAASYGTVYEAFPDAVHLGVTATMARGDGVGLGRQWDDVVYQRSVLRMIADGYLTDVRGIAVATDLDLSTVKRSGGDYSAGSLGAAMMEVDAQKVVAKAMLQHARDRHSIVFTPTVAVAEETARELCEVGIPAAVVSGSTPTDERRRAYAAFEAGRLRALVNCAVLTEGFDSPRTDCCVIARPTRSAGLYQQMVGRALRLYPGKTDALVLDISGTGGNLATLVDLSTDSDNPVRSIKDGETLTEAAVREEAEANTPVKAGSIAFALKHKELDLFAASTTAWLRTPAGVMFIAARAGEVFLWPSKTEPGAWSIGFAPPQNRPWRMLRDGLPLGTAMAWAETEAEDLSDFSLERKASWRKKPADDRARSFYRSRYGGSLPAALTAGDLSDRIAVAEASRKFDQKMRGVKR